MNKPFLLIAGANYYPGSGTNDWQGCFATRKEAEAQVPATSHDVLYRKGESKGKIKSTWHTYKIAGKPFDFDWYEVVDLRSWTE